MIMERNEMNPGKAMRKRGARNVLDYLEFSARLYPEKDAYEDANLTVTFAEMLDLSQRIGTALTNRLQKYREPVAVFMDKSVQTIAAFFGVLYSGNFYCPLDVGMPPERIQIILDVLMPEYIITDLEHKELAEHFGRKDQILIWEDLIKQEKEEVLLQRIRNSMTEQDPLYVLFTSGSTGIPKGVLLSHRVITNYLEWLEDTFDMDEDCVFGNQAPFYFDVSVHDIYGILYFGAKMVIIPQTMFSFPIRLIEYMNERKISTFLWVPSAMSILSNLQAFDVAVPKYLRQIMFAGEVFPRKQLDYWRKYIPNAVYANLYGPTETSSPFSPKTNACVLATGTGIL